MNGDWQPTLKAFETIHFCKPFLGLVTILNIQNSTRDSKNPIAMKILVRSRAGTTS